MAKTEEGTDILFFSVDELTGNRTVSRNAPCSREAERRGDGADRGNGEDGWRRDGAVLPRVESGADIVRRACILEMDPATLMGRYDDALPFVPDLFDRYRRMIERLDNPLYLSDEKRGEHIRTLTCARQVVCEVFAKHDFVQGIDSLAAHGIVNAADLGMVIDRLAGNPMTVTAMARLLELKRSLPCPFSRDYSL